MSDKLAIDKASRWGRCYHFDGVSVHQNLVGFTGARVDFHFGCEATIRKADGTIFRSHTNG